MNIIKLFIILILCGGCNNSKCTNFPDDIVDEDVDHTINLEECLNNVKTMKLSALLEKSEKIPNSSVAYKNFLKTIDEDKSNPILILAKRK